MEPYRKKFDEAGVTPEGCRSLADLSRFPFTTKADLRDTYPFGMFAVPMDRIRRVHASSGTTGRPTVVGYTENDLAMWADVVARSIVNTDLGGYLRQMRERVRPEQMGLRSSGSRRVPGLRREGVAALAGVSQTYYTRLEQSQTAHASPQALLSIARACN